MNTFNEHAISMSTPADSDDEPRGKHRARGKPAIRRRHSCGLCASAFLISALALSVLGSRLTATSSIAVLNAGYSSTQQQPSWRLASKCANSSSAGPSTAQLLQWLSTASSALQAEWGHVVVERPLPTSQERSLSSATFDAIQASSLNPPSPALASAIEQLEMDSRLIIAIATGVHSGGKPSGQLTIDGLHIVKTTLSSFVPTVRSAYVYRFYLAFDSVDPVFNQSSTRAAVTLAFQEAIARESAKRWHLDRPQTGTIDPSVLIVSLHWVLCNYTGKPAWAQNDAALAAFKEGADYVLRTNDDTLLPSTKGWETTLINDLRSRRPVPNLGVVGPSFSEGHTGILTHDFTHRTHAIIHGFYYPRELPTWYADDWITKVYSGFTNPPLMVKRKDVVVEHILAAQRYAVLAPANVSAVVEHLVKTGKESIRKFVLQNYNVTPTK